MHTFWGTTLYHPEDLPQAAFSKRRSQNDNDIDSGLHQVEQSCQIIPRVMSDFRKVNIKAMRWTVLVHRCFAGASDCQDIQHWEYMSSDHHE